MREDETRSGASAFNWRKCEMRLPVYITSVLHRGLCRSFYFYRIVDFIPLSYSLHEVQETVGKLKGKSTTYSSEWTFFYKDISCCSWESSSKAQNDTL